MSCFNGDTSLRDFYIMTLHVCNEIPAFFDGKYKQVSSILNVWDILIPHLMVKNIVASGLLGRATYDGSGIQGAFISKSVIRLMSNGSNEQPRLWYMTADT